MNFQNKLREIEQSRKLLNPFEQQALNGELKPVLQTLMKQLKEKGYVQEICKNENFSEDYSSFTFFLYVIIDLIKTRDQYDLSPLEKSPLLVILNPNLKNIDEGKVFAKKVFDDLQASVN